MLTSTAVTSAHGVRETSVGQAALGPSPTATLVAPTQPPQSGQQQKRCNDGSDCPDLGQGDEHPIAVTTTML